MRACEIAISVKLYALSLQMEHTIKAENYFSEHRNPFPVV